LAASIDKVVDIEVVEQQGLAVASNDDVVCSSSSSSTLDLRKQL